MDFINKYTDYEKDLYHSYDMLTLGFCWEFVMPNFDPSVTRNEGSNSYIYYSLQGYENATLPNDDSSFVIEIVE